jgi:uroporphyrin-3 C-methyltransferase
MTDGDSGARRTGAGGAGAQVRGGGRGLALFATLLSLAAIGIAGYPYYERFIPGASSQPDGTLDALRQEQLRQAEDVRRLIDGAAALDARLAQRAVSAADAMPANADGSNGIASPHGPVAQRALDLAEAEFLMRSANDRLLVTHDVRAALAMLTAAQTLIDQIDDQTLVDVRGALTSEIALLRDVSGVDVRQTFERLERVAAALAELPARGVRFTPAELPETPVGAQAPSAWLLAWEKFLSLFEFRRQGLAAHPPLGPDEATYLRLNLGLTIQAAQLALLRNDAAVYQQSLESVRRWIADYLDTTSQDVATVRSEIDQLLAVRLDRPLPDISGSLAALQRMGAAAPAAPAATAEAGGAP